MQNESANENHQILYLLGWLTHRTRPILEGPLREEVQEAIMKIAAENNWVILSLNISPSHVATKILASSNVSAAQLVRILKTGSAAGMRSRHAVIKKMPGLWTRTYFATTVQDGDPEEMLRKYFDTHGKKH